MLGLLFSNPYAFVIIFGGIILAIGVHEAAHCYMADHLGDPTPASAGRLTLNPLAHLDPLGTLVILISGMFGWGKPSPFDPYNLKHPRRDTALIALAGPASNLLLAIVFSLILRLVQLPNSLFLILYSLISLNINLAIFNLIPIPPLDGSKIFTQNFGPPSQFQLLLLLLLIATGLIQTVLSPISSFLLHILI
ncbi:site-2 protease family protein [Candidatus Amesbacteria bacterium]|nr:site-2 protease family protein [Candidatus Amesbacteria bacterium]MBI2587453.1 site-2 protease family protein [Candidatus Amesbacteria bacterium]